MKVPNYEQAIIQPNKLMKYLLNFEHPKGSSKAKFFKKHGYDLSNTSHLEVELKRIIVQNEVTEIITTPFGLNYSVIAYLESKTLTNPLIKTVWTISHENDAPYFVTAYPF